MPGLSDVTKNAKKIKEQLATQAGVKTSEVNDANLSEAGAALDGAQKVVQAGQDPTKVDFSQLKEMGGSEKSDTPEQLSRQQKLAYALTAIAPTILGYAFGGAEGGATGARVTAGAIDQINKQDADNAKSARETAEKKELKQQEISARAEENAKDREARAENAREAREANAPMKVIAAQMAQQRLDDAREKKELSKSVEGRIQKLGAEGKQRLDNATMGLTSVQGMADALNDGQNTFSVWGDNDFTQQRTNFEEALGRMQSGGAISKDEELRFKKMAPTFQDKPEMRKKKLIALQTEMAKRIGTLGFKPEELGLAVRDLNAPPKKAGGMNNPAIPTANAGGAEPDFDNMTNEQLQEYLSGGQ